VHSLNLQSFFHFLCYAVFYCPCYYYYYYYLHIYLLITYLTIFFLTYTLIYLITDLINSLLTHRKLVWATPFDLSEQRCCHPGMNLMWVRKKRARYEKRNTHLAYTKLELTKRICEYYIPSCSKMFINPLYNCQYKNKLTHHLLSKLLLSNKMMLLFQTEIQKEIQGRCLCCVSCTCYWISVDCEVLSFLPLGGIRLLSCLRLSIRTVTFNACNCKLRNLQAIYYANRWLNPTF
jgi:hypothetical protein